MKSIKKVYVVIIILVVLSIIGFCASYAFFSNINEEHGKLNIVVGDLAYKLESSDLVDYKITVPANTTKELTIELTSLNNIDSKYELYYKLDEKNDNVMVGYSDSTVDPVSGTIKANEKKTITLIIVNSSSTSSTVFISVTGGLVNNTLVLSTGSGLNNLIDQTTSFAKVLLASNELIAAKPTLTNSSNNTSDKSGLYASTDTNSGNPTYYFRGNVTNNYVSFAGYTWRIVRINEDGTIRIVMQDGINNNTAYKFNSNYNDYTYMYYSNSEAKTTLESWYNTNIGSNSDLVNQIASGNYFCEQAKVKYRDSYTSGSATMEISYLGYTPDFKCSNDGNGKGVVNASVGLLTYDEVVYAGGYPYQSNNDYYLNNSSIQWWTMSPAGLSDPYSCVWYVYSTGNLYDHYVAGTNRIRPVLNLNSDVQISGSGTSDDPYVVGPVSFNYSTDVQTYQVLNSGIYKIEAAGTGVSGKGTLVTGYSQLNKGDILYINAGSVGAGGVKGGDCYGQNGGGASFVRLNTTDGEPIIVAGGGGGYTSSRDGVGSLGAATTTAGNSTPSSNSIRNQGSTGNYYSDSAGTDNHQYRQSMGGGGGGYYGGSAGICYRSDTRCWNWTGGYAGTSFIDFDKVKNYDETTKSLTEIEYTGTSGNDDFVSDNVSYGAVSGNGYVKISLVQD